MVALKEKILELLLEKTKEAELNRVCKRKGVYSGIYINYGTDLSCLWSEKNGSIVECSGEIGKCGCCHAEVRTIIRGMVSGGLRYITGLLMLCSYSPCTSCAHVIGVSGFIGEVVWLHDTEHDIRGIEILKKYGITARNIRDL